MTSGLPRGPREPLPWPCSRSGRPPAPLRVGWPTSWARRPAALVNRERQRPGQRGDGMADSFLRRWFGSPRAAEPAAVEAQAELERLAAARPALQPVVRWLIDMLPELTPHRASSPSLSLEPKQARDRLK